MRLNYLFHKILCRKLPNPQPITGEIDSRKILTGNKKSYKNRKGSCEEPFQSENLNYKTE